jgi:hypothetical protein
MMDKINWDKKIALEIIQAGFIRMSKKFHPDVGGTQEQMLVLTATKEHLEKSIAAGRHDYTGDAFTYTRAREEPRRRSTYRNTRSQYWDQADRSKEHGFTGEVPLEAYPDDSDYVQLRDVTIMSVTEKAFKIKIPTVKQPQWLPKSQVLWELDNFSRINEPIEGDVVTIVFTKWIAKQKGWLK